MTMKRQFALALTVALFAAACSGSSSSPTTSSPTKPTFTAELKTSNEVPAITGAEASGSGTASITFDQTANTVTFVVNLSGFPAGTPINIAHIHTGAAGVSGAVLVTTTLAAGEVTLANGSGSFSKTAPVTADVAQGIINNPAGFYFNVHSTLNPGGVARGQLVKVQ
jgi:hypothetical protein